MTDLYEDWKDRSLGAPAIAADLKQFQKLQHLDDEAVAFRMASTVVEVRRLRKMFGQSNIKLVNTKLPYQLRLLLGAQGVSTVGQLLALSDAKLLSIPTIGTKRLALIRACLSEALR